ncbi:2-hydroxyacid dehydrogenase [Acidomonas methanolica]|uniref:D-isomer specific 2-hydroxyacid dehydrogenase n=1 Tax=Acidomonas methanolica NBRC 104435 TaxID=1231351 RepID=A0A023D432_ACIMT|nr:glyoxylate/hydroxypyruvate reductase A [Acidomonas methanolica]MBU2653757.1 glyoxylate/hydroxypyruvate reductase A [Acidomonas methanolica]TCS31710.1 glyoxylate/hydroxypyruvate reductase A [Acidomonas methanolica]GAJ28923.1 D-isomer specific 2-hydroxyacid dehydrogenase [Acidomonas methanolica NBRC 104435]GBQ54668.1 D-isomer specific 2-hydroxyacid dehydrogenase [Acidomonas methanolica]GEK98127.1 glyoxylate/hydroxypyruvate reductase A [Acidomonas methanolica NBRC 104435]
MTSIVINGANAAELAAWRKEFAACAPDWDVLDWNDPALDPAKPDFAFVYRPEGKRLAAMPNLRAVISQAAGVDHILDDPDFPRSLPVYRMGGEEVSGQMGDYVCWAAFTLLRKTWRWARLQQRHEWHTDALDRRMASEVTVGVMGLGQLGLATLERLKGAGFRVAGWARSAHVIDGVATFHGADGLAPFLRGLDFVVSLLPATPETDDLLNARMLALLRPGGGVINAGRGNQVNEADLIAALRSGALSGAVLDVFAEEPLPPDSPLWDCPGIIISPHSASDASYRARAQRAVEIIRDLLAGREAPLKVDPAQGY